jgi:hypothetical protein
MFYNQHIALTAEVMQKAAFYEGYKTKSTKFQSRYIRCAIALTEDSIRWFAEMGDDNAGTYAARIPSN